MFRIALIADDFMDGPDAAEGLDARSAPLATAQRAGGGVAALAALGVSVPVAGGG